MKNTVTYFMSLFMVLIIQTMATAQADTVMVPFIYEGDPNGAISRFINADTTATGERNNPDRYYELERGKIYFTSGTMIPNFTLRLIAKAPDADNKPPVVASATGADGKPIAIMFICNGDAHIKNIAFAMTPPGGIGESQACFSLEKEGGNYSFDGVTFEWGLYMMIRTIKPVNKIEVKNCYFRNNEHKTDIWNGRGVGFYQKNPADTVLMTNNTFFNMNSFAFVADISSYPPDYFLFDHNTLVNTMKYPIHSFWLPNAVVTNNLFYNSSSFGETDADKIGQDPDELIYGIIDISRIPDKILGFQGITEEERKYVVRNNGHFYTDGIKKYWDKYSIEYMPWMNKRTQGMFDDDDKYPYLELGKVCTEDPGIVNAGGGEAKMIKWMKNRRKPAANNYWGWDPDGDKFAMQWPRPEDLSYTNEAVKKCADDNYPLGDLNWWPGLLEKWGNGEVIDTKNEDISIFENISVSPNPTSNNIVLNYNLASKSAVQIDIHDMTGRKLVKVLDVKQNIGLHTINADFDLPNGIYVIRLKAGTSVVSKKFVVVK